MRTCNACYQLVSENSVCSECDWNCVTQAYDRPEWTEEQNNE
jgi:hypothetical protein